MGRPNVTVAVARIAVPVEHGDPRRAALQAALDAGVDIVHEQPAAGLIRRAAARPGLRPERDAGNPFEIGQNEDAHHPFPFPFRRP